MDGSRPPTTTEAEPTRSAQERIDGPAGAEPSPVSAFSQVAAVTEVDTSFAAFYRSEYQRFVRVAYLLLGSEEAAEEVVQDSFVRLHGRWSRVENPSAYLRMSVVNASRDSIRRRVRWRRREPLVATAASVTDEPDELFDALSRLNPRQRAVVVLRFYDGLQEAEIAEAVGMKVGTVKSTLHRSIERLRKEIER